jgi:hypothetical protein
MADGTLKPIDEIKVGELVLAYDEQTQRTHAAAVLKLFVHEEWQKQASTILINGRLRATTNHPFFVQGSWQRAEYLKPGNLLRSLVPTPLEREGRTTTSENVTSLVALPGVDTVYNLEIDRYHTYFAEGLLVHNVATKH